MWEEVGERVCSCSAHGVAVLCNSGCEDGIAEQAPSSGGNLPSDRHLTRHFYSCSKGMSAAEMRSELRTLPVSYRD